MFTIQWFLSCCSESSSFRDSLAPQSSLDDSVVVLGDLSWVPSYQAVASHPSPSVYRIDENDQSR